jgi:hypothetical protein
MHSNSAGAHWFSCKLTRHDNYDILDILREIKSYKLHVTNIEERLRSKRLISFPQAIAKNLVVLVEFTDCIIQARDLLSYDVVVDDDKQRSLRRKQEQQAKEAELGFANSLKIKPIYH